MPTIRVEMFEGRTEEQKRAYVKALTKVTTQILWGSPDSVDILFYEVPARHWATGGELWSDKQKK